MQYLADPIVVLFLTSAFWLALGLVIQPGGKSKKQSQRQKPTRSFKLPERKTGAFRAQMKTWAESERDADLLSQWYYHEWRPGKTLGAYPKHHPFSSIPDRLAVTRELVRAPLERGFPGLTRDDRELCKHVAVILEAVSEDVYRLFQGLEPEHFTEHWVKTVSEPEQQLKPANGASIVFGEKPEAASHHR